MPVNTSSLVSAIASTPERRTPLRTTIASNHPQRLGRPVVAPYSPPSTRRRSPSASASSVGNGPLPTRVVYALEMPITRLTSFGETPAPFGTPPDPVLDDVTN